jgi:hypothetical protein
LEDARAKRYKSTGNWFLQGDSFKDYQGKKGKHIWLHGIRESPNKPEAWIALTLTFSRMWKNNSNVSNFCPVSASLAKS